MKKWGIGILIILCFAGVTLFVYREWTHRNPPVIELPENSEIIGGGV